LLSDIFFNVNTYWVGMNRAIFAEFIFNLRNCYSQSCLYIGITY
jgi:hypothetical protein